MQKYDVAIGEGGESKRIGDRVRPGIANIGDGRNEVPCAGKDRQAGWCQDEELPGCIDSGIDNIQLDIG